MTKINERPTSTSHQRSNSHKRKSNFSHRSGSAGTPRGEQGDLSSRGNRRGLQIDQLMKQKKNVGEQKFQKIVLKRNNKAIGQVKKPVGSEQQTTSIPARLIRHVRNLSGQSNNSGSISRTAEKMKLQMNNGQQTSSNQMLRESMYIREKGITADSLDRGQKMMPSHGESKYQKLKQR